MASAFEAMKPSRPTIADIARNYAAEKMHEEWRGEWGVVALYRPVAILITPIFLRLSISASAVTLTSLLLGLCLPMIAIWGGTPAYVGVGCGAIIIVVLDCVDGNIARMTRTVTSRGHYLDFITDIVFRLCLYAAAGILAETTSNPAWLMEYALGIAMTAAALAIAARMSRIYAETLTGVASPPQTARASRSLMEYGFSAVSGLDHLLPVAILVAGWFGGMGWIVVWLIFYSALDFLYTQIAIFRRLV